MNDRALDCYASFDLECLFTFGRTDNDTVKNRMRVD